MLPSHFSGNTPHLLRGASIPLDVIHRSSKLVVDPLTRMFKNLYHELRRLAPTALELSQLTSTATPGHGNQRLREFLPLQRLLLSRDSPGGGRPRLGRAAVVMTPSSCLDVRSLLLRSWGVLWPLICLSVSRHTICRRASRAPHTNSSHPLHTAKARSLCCVLCLLL